MDEIPANSPDDSAGHGDKAGGSAVPSSDSSLPLVAAPRLGAGEDDHIDAAADETASDSNLPLIVSPKLGAGEDDHSDAAADKTAGASAGPAAPANSRRFLVLAASVAFAAAFGSLIGSVTGSGLARYLYPPAPASGGEEFAAALQAMKAQFAELSAIKVNLDSATRNSTSQFAKIADRLDRLDQRSAAAAAAATTAKVPETTGSIVNGSNAPSPVPPSEPPKLADRILPDWIVQDVQNGRALVESRYGGIFDVGAGSVLPGIGRVETVKRQDGQWVVVTARGLITSGR